MLVGMTLGMIVGILSISSIQEKKIENDCKHFVSDSIFKRLKFEYSSLETV